MNPNRTITRENRSESVSTADAALVPQAWDLLGHDRQDDVVVMQHLVVLQVVQQGGRHILGIPGEEDRGPGNTRHGAALGPAR